MNIYSNTIISHSDIICIAQNTQLAANVLNVQATQNLLRCLNHGCCPNHRPTAFPNRATDAESIRYLSTKCDGKDKQGTDVCRPVGEKDIKEFIGSFDDFKAQVVDAGSCTITPPGKCTITNYLVAVNPKNVHF